jgi:23S rRNA pseudouridine2457 synthase
VITEGKNRQIRRMTAAVGHPTLRLVRVKIGNWTLEGIEPGKYKVETINLPANAPGARPVRPGNNRPAAARPENAGLKTTAQKPVNKPKPKSAAQKKSASEKPAEKKATIIIQKTKRALDNDK